VNSDRILTLDDFEVGGKTVLLRVDINCPVETDTKKIKDDTRIKRSIRTIKELTEKKARLVVLAHQGDPLDYQNFSSLSEHRSFLEKELGKKIGFVEDVAGPAALERLKKLDPGEILLLDNVRIHTEETIIFEKEVKLTPEQQAGTIVVRKLAPLADYYVCDAFACVHRSEPSLVGFPEVLPSAAGRLFEEELECLTKVRDRPARPCIYILGGAKILDAFQIIKAVLENNSADRILTTGLVSHIMLKAGQYDLGRPSERLLEEKNLIEFIQPAGKILNLYPDRITCPEDFGVDQKGLRKEIGIQNLPADGIISDIGTRSIEKYKNYIYKSKTVFMNGPAGIYENPLFAQGTKEIWEAVANSDTFSVIGGGDTIAAAKKFNLEKKFSYISTAGGGLIRFLSGEELPVIRALKKASTKFGR
jgi:phosphoglycerate kinase